MTSTPTPEPGERCAYIYSDGSTCDRFETDLTTHSIVGHGFVPAPSTPGEGTGEQRCVHCGQSPDDPGASMCQTWMAGVSW